MGRSFLSATRFVGTLVVMAMLCSLAWDGLVNGRLYDSTHGGSLDFWFVGHWAHNPVTVDRVASGRSMIEPDTIKAGWSITGLWSLWSCFVASSLLVSLAFATVSWTRNRRDVAMVLARLVLGALFLYMGFNKALLPEGFLKLVREYNMVQNHLLLNSIAVTLPWFEVFCGFLLVAGVGVRGAALNLILMLIPFTSLVLWRALADPAFAGQTFRTIKFDCGCGNGEVFITHKLIENCLLLLLSALLLFCRSHKLCLWYSVMKSTESANGVSRHEREVFCARTR